jgi:hypothetical protein
MMELPSGQGSDVFGTEGPWTLPAVSISEWEKHACWANTTEPRSVRHSVSQSASYSVSHSVIQQQSHILTFSNTRLDLFIQPTYLLPIRRADTKSPFVIT